MHTEWTLRALEAGKHVLCEKPFATNPTDAARCFDAAEAAGAVVVEGFMWRHHPQTGGRPTVPDPWLCRAGAVELETGGRTQRLLADPDGAWGLTGEEADAYRIEFDVVSAAIAAGDPTGFGRADAVDQAAVLEAVGRSAATGLPVELPPSAAGPGSSSGHPPGPLAGPSDADERRLLGAGEASHGQAEQDQAGGGHDRHLERHRDVPAAPGDAGVEGGPGGRAQVEMVEHRRADRLDGIGHRVEGGGHVQPAGQVGQGEQRPGQEHQRGDG
jgi:hypothetical protein